MTGLAIVSKRTKTGRRWYIYAWRGGPCIHTQDGERPVITRAILDAQYAARQSAIDRVAEDMDWLIALYETSPAFATKRESTKRDYRLWLTRISERFGKTPLAAFTDWRMRGDVLQWRDQWAHQPRSADKAIVMMVTLLNWAIENGKLERHHCHGIGLLHSVDRSDLIWEDRHWSAVDGIKDFPPHLMTAIRLKSLTGLRLSDLVGLQWGDVYDKQITVMTQKRKRRAIIPIFPELRTMLDNIGRKPSGPVLLNSRGRGWTPSGLESVWQRWRPEGFDRTLHDLRGTFVTRLAVKGLTDEQIAQVIGWQAARVAVIRARYVDQARVVVSLVERLSG